MIRARGIDLSKYDLKFIPGQAVEQIDFVIQRLSYGMVQDQAFEVLLPGVLEVELRGGYHYLSSAVPWRDSANRFLDIAGGKYHFFACDFERYYNNVNARFRDDCLNWITYVEMQTRKPVLLYTNVYLYNTWFSSIPVVKQIPLWLAYYGRFWPFVMPNSEGNPWLPNNRPNWHFWQYWDRGNGVKYGAGRPHALDLDVFNGSVDQLRVFLGKQSEIPTQPALPLYTATVTAWVLTVRGGPSTAYRPVAYMVKGNRVEVWKEQGAWVKIDKDMDRWVHSGYLKKV